MNMQQILNDPELTKELDKAYKLAAPYREKVQYKLSIIKQAIVVNPSYILHPFHGMLISFPLKASKPYIHPMLKV